VEFKTVARDRANMVDILAENLSGKAVMSADGTELGDLYNITMDLKSGELSDLLEPPTSTSARSDRASTSTKWAI